MNVFGELNFSDTSTVAISVARKAVRRCSISNIESSVWWITSGRGLSPAFELTPLDDLFSFEGGGDQLPQLSASSSGLSSEDDKWGRSTGATHSNSSSSSSLLPLVALAFILRTSGGSGVVEEVVKGRKTNWGTQLRGGSRGSLLAVEQESGEDNDDDSDEDDDDETRYFNAGRNGKRLAGNIGTII